MVIAEKDNMTVISEISSHLDQIPHASLDYQVEEFVIFTSFILPLKIKHISCKHVANPTKSRQKQEINRGMHLTVELCP